MPQMQQSADTSAIENLLTAIAGTVTSGFDYIALTYVASGNGVGQVETATYKTGGALGTTVATITLTYNADHRIADMTVT